MSDATTQLNNITPEHSKQMKMMLGLVSAQITGQIANLQNADTQTEFDEAIQQIIQLVQQAAQKGGMGPGGNNGFNPNGPNN